MPPAKLLGLVVICLLDLYRLLSANRLISCKPIIVAYSTRSDVAHSLAIVMSLVTVLSLPRVTI